ncbi:hypothetical protein A2456_02085 [Candidatus Nomurabacteria bacterium RIFOXYC2_FULL_36_19]|nr:MAG: hypothetical protein A2238_00085 [Candidatus Nomurabacteria bacterium RIFOXYA2_FULL_35_9]OGJ09143.1 MAG: hypothetical protein A2456_02085 [Candidatus Nomurabacteria bacterium RIFOXYC2_FULL_36_19]OGJ14219.1 MAG: hypothetical protein A2554_01660 [Candidatus Nomurabacteria bacterium RIFOXYD2_FULL_35_12]
MRIHTKEKIKKLKLLRQKGYSINDLVTKLQIPKTTVWHHIHKVKVSSKFLSLIKSRQGGSKKRKELKLIEAKVRSINLLKSDDRESILIFAMLYWAEGTKKAFQFINSDGRMIVLWLNILRNIIGVSNDKITPVMRIYTGMNRKVCLSYWSKITKFPKSKFIIRLNDGGKSGKTKYGMCRIDVKKSGNLLKLVLSIINEVCLEYGIVL